MQLRRGAGFTIADANWGHQSYEATRNAKKAPQRRATADWTCGKKPRSRESRKVQIVFHDFTKSHQISRAIVMTKFIRAICPRLSGKGAE